MKLRYITFTGPDDRTNPDEMVQISKEFPQVEWGILLSPSQATWERGSPRFPSHDWLTWTRLAFHRTPANFAGHLCGGYLRDLISGNFTASADRQEDFRIFQRFQLNFHGNAIPSVVGLESVLRSRHDVNQFIFQMDGVNEPIFHWLRERAIPLMPLFDQSHGEGVLPTTYPQPLGELCGYAGGLGPDNLQEQLQRLETQVGDRSVWVDMETRVRNDQEEFDLNKVNQCIDIAAPYF